MLKNLGFSTNFALDFKSPPTAVWVNKNTNSIGKIVVDDALGRCFLQNNNITLQWRLLKQFLACRVRVKVIVDPVLRISCLLRNNFRHLMLWSKKNQVPLQGSVVYYRTMVKRWCKYDNEYSLKPKNSTNNLVSLMQCFHWIWKNIVFNWILTASGSKDNSKTKLNIQKPRNWGKQNCSTERFRTSSRRAKATIWYKFFYILSRTNNICGGFCQSPNLHLPIHNCTGQRTCIT